MDNASIQQMVLDASMVLNTPTKNLYVGYLSGNGVPPNAFSFTQGINFPTDPATGAFCLRTDYLPNVMYRFDSKHWIMYEDNVRMTMNNFGAQDVGAGQYFEGKAIRETQKKSFVNNTNTSTVNGKVIVERQALSKALKPKADN
jgi:hypothetical protein